MHLSNYDRVSLRFQKVRACVGKSISTPYSSKNGRALLRTEVGAKIQMRKHLDGDYNVDRVHGDGPPANFIYKNSKH
jgi:hypothetical protein